MIIDLSVHLDDRTPAYPGDPHYEAHMAGTFERDGYSGHAISMGTHTGTHIDAPAHMLPEGGNIDLFPASRFVGRGCYVDASGGFSVEALELADMQPGDIVLFDTGTAPRFYEPDYFTRFPVMSPGVSRYLVDKQISMVGVDTCSIDTTPDFSNHKTLLGAQILVIENLTNLGALAGREFKVYALPLALGLDAAPARVIAEVRV